MRSLKIFRFFYLRMIHKAKTKAGHSTRQYKSSVVLLPLEGVIDPHMILSKKGDYRLIFKAKR